MDAGAAGVGARDVDVQDAAPAGSLAVQVLGGLRATRDGRPLDLGGRRQRAVLALLVLARGQVVPAERLAADLWGADPPASASGALQSYVSHLRRRLSPETGARNRDAVIASAGPGYAVRLDTAQVDSWQFEHLLRAAAEQADPRARGATLGRALELWHGPAYADHADEPWAQAEAARLSELQSVARERLLEARLDAGEAALLVPELEAMVGQEPLREERWRLLALALYRAHRQADALSALRRARTTLADELGVDPGPALRLLETEVLAQSPALDGRPRALPVEVAPPESAPPAPAQRTPPPAPAEPLSDRDGEVRELTGALEQVAAGGCRVLVVEGPAGIGKTRLLAEARRLAAERALPVLGARGSQLERSYGFGVVRQLFEPALRDEAARAELLSGAAASARSVFDLVEGELRPDGSLAVLHGLYWLAVNLAARGPVVLAVDDLQWCDSGSLRFLAYLARRLDSLPVLLLGTVRTGERHDDEALLAELYDVAAQPLRPAPLSPEATRAMVADRLGAPAASFADACHRTTSGNPLLLRQLIRALEAERIRPDAAHTDTVLAVGSRAVSSMVLMRLRRMPPRLTVVAHAVAVLGDGAQLPVVASLAELPEDETAAALADLTRAEVVRRELPLGFVHPLVRDAVYRDLPPGERELQHQRAAAALRRLGGTEEQIAAHLLLAPHRGDPDTVALLRSAARTAADRGAADSAVTLLRRALAEPAVGEPRTTVLLELGLLETLVDGPAGTRHLEEAYPRLADPAVRGEVAIAMARNHLFASDRGVASAFARRARLSLPEEVSDARQGLLALERISAFMQGLDRRTWLDGERPEVQGRRHGARMLAATLSWEHAVEGTDRAEAVRLARFALDGDRLFAVDNGLLWIVAAGVVMVADEELGDYWHRAQAEAHARGSLFAALAVNLWRGFDEWRHGDLREAAASVAVAREQAQMWHPGGGVGESYGVAFLLWVLLDRGDVAGARALLDGTRGVVRMGDGARLLQEAEVAVLLAEGRAAEAEVATRALPAGIPNPAWTAWRSLRAGALAGLGRVAEADALLVEELAAARAWGGARTTGRVLRALGELRGGSGLELLREAVDVLATVPAAVELARARLSLGRSPDVTDDEAVPLLTAAADAAHASGAEGIRDDALGELGRRGRTIVLPDDAALSMTTTHRRVRELAGAGLDVRAVAQELFLTPGTVLAVLDGAEPAARTG